MDDNLNQHIDKKLQESFNAVEQKAPSHLWENISEQLDLGLPLDELLDEKVQESFLNQTVTTPSFLWDVIAADLDESTMLDNTLDDKLKDSFSSNLDKKAPVFLWGAIADDLNVQDELLDTQLDATIDEKVKESFAAQKTPKTPASVWYAISQQLNIDKTWTKISSDLDSKPVVSDWRSRMMKFFAAAAMLLLLLKTCDYNPKPIALNTNLEEFSKQANEVKSQSKQNTLSENNVINHSKNSTTVTKNNNSSTKVTTELEEPNRVALSNVDNKVDYNVDHNKAKNKATKKVTTTTVIPLKNKKTSSKNKLKNDSKKEVDLPLAIHDEKTNNSSSFTIENSSLEIQNLEGRSIENTTVETKQDLPINWAMLIALNAGQISMENTVEPVLKVEELSLVKKEKKNLVADKLAIGAFVVVNSTMLLNNQTREGFDKNSLVQNHFGLAANYGIWASYNITPKGALVGEFSFNADNNQAYGVYDRGTFYIKEWVLKYNRISLAYKHDFLSTNGSKKVNTKLVGQAGVYLGFLREAKLFYNGELFYDAIGEHNQFDFGFKVSLGQDIIIDKFVIGYGIRTDIGVTNIFKGNGRIAAEDNETRVINLGGYISLGYRF